MEETGKVFTDKETDWQESLRFTYSAHSSLREYESLDEWDKSIFAPTIAQGDHEEIQGEKKSLSLD